MIFNQTNNNRGDVVNNAAILVEGMPRPCGKCGQTVNLLERPEMLVGYPDGGFLQWTTESWFCPLCIESEREKLRKSAVNYDPKDFLFSVREPSSSSTETV